MEEMTIPMMLKKINDLMYSRANADLEQMNLTLAQMHVLIRLHENDKEEVPLEKYEGFGAVFPN